MDQTAVTAQTGTPDALRPLGSVERYFWLSDQNSPKHFCMALQVSGETTPARWKAALGHLRARHPLLRVSIGSSSDGRPVFLEAGDRDLPLRVIPCEQPHDWEGTISKQLMEPFPDDAPSLVRAVLLHSWSFSTLIFTAHHSVADGISVAYLMRDLLLAMEEQPLSPLALPPAQETIAARWGIVAEPLSAGGRKATKLDRSRGVPHVSSLRLSSKLTSDLRASARSNGTTVHGALVAALVLAGRRLHKAWQQGPVRTVSPVNMRPTLEIADDCVVSIVFPSGAYAPEPDGDLWELARAVKADLADAKSRSSIVNAFAAFDAIMTTSPGVPEIAEIELTVCACEMMLSNVGVAPLPETAGSLKVEALWGPSVFVGIEGEQMIGCATFAGRIHLLHTSFTPIPSLLSLTRAMLEQAASD